MSKFILRNITVVILILVALGVWSFKSNSTLDTHPISRKADKKTVLQDSLFNAYWYVDGAEINSYKLTQSRYGEHHQGTATVIFVAQQFSKKKGVKPDKNRNISDHIPILKMNLLKKFGTGIYPYSMMLSTFTPLKEAQGLTKATASGQEWCGQIFSQMNNRGKHYDVASYSYFEEEGDREFKLPTIFTEDEIWSRIRMDYHHLPQGDIDIIPGLYYTRLEQHKHQTEKANATLKKGEKTSTYSLTYPKRERTLVISFNTEFPHKITKWEETYADKRAPTKRLTTTAVLDQSKKIDYWNYNAEKYKTIRKELGVPY